MGALPPFQRSEACNCPPRVRAIQGAKAWLVGSCRAPAALPAGGDEGRRLYRTALFLPLQPFDILIRKAEMMADFVDQHVSHQAEQVFSGFDPFQQDGFAK